MLQSLRLSSLILCQQSSRGAPTLTVGTEIIPVEPDQGNACEGR